MALEANSLLGTSNETQINTYDSLSGEEHKRIDELKNPPLLRKYNNLIILRSLVELSAPAALNFVLEYSITFITLIFCGFYGTEVFAAASLSTMFCNITGVSILYGMSSSVTTLCSQYYGAEEFYEVGLTVHRSIYVLTILCIPIIILWNYAGSIYLLFGIETKVCVIIQNIVLLRCLGLPADIIILTFKRYLMALGITSPQLIAGILLIILLVISNMICIHYFHLGYIYLIVSVILSEYMSAAILIYYSLAYPLVQQTLTCKYDNNALNKLDEFVALGLPGCAMVCTEWWTYEILSLFASMLGLQAVAAQTIMLQLIVTVFMLPLGLGSAASTLVGQAYGACNFNLASRVTYLSIMMIFVLDVIIGFILKYDGIYFVYLFSMDPIVLQMIRNILPYFSICVVIDGMQGVCSGSITGMGWQATGALTNLFSYYAVGLPTAWILCFVYGWGLTGLIVGVYCGTACQMTSFLIALLYGHFGPPIILKTNQSLIELPH